MAKQSAVWVIGKVTCVRFLGKNIAHAIWIRKGNTKRQIQDNLEIVLHEESIQRNNFHNHECNPMDNINMHKIVIYRFLFHREISRSKSSIYHFWRRKRYYCCLRLGKYYISNHIIFFLRQAKERTKWLHETMAVFLLKLKSWLGLLVQLCTMLMLILTSQATFNSYLTCAGCWKTIQ